MLAFNADFHKDSQALFRVGNYMNVLARDQILIQAYGIFPDDHAALDGHDVIPMVEWQSASGMPTRLAIRYAGEQEATLAWGKPQTGVTSLTDCLSDPDFCDRLCAAFSQSLNIPVGVDPSAQTAPQPRSLGEAAQVTGMAKSSIHSVSAAPVQPEAPQRRSWFNR
jgi:hypothetical protein